MNSKKTHRVKRDGRKALQPASELAQAVDTHDAAEMPSETLARQPELKAIIGQEIKFWRNERGLTGAKLAQKSEISAGMLTKIEKGHVAPSLQTLVQIAEALNLPISMLFYRLQKSRYVSFVPAGKGLLTDASGTRANHVTEMLGHNIGHAMGIEPFLIQISEASTPYPNFQEEGFKFIHMMEGEIIYRHGDRDFHLKPGDSLTFDAMSPHGAAEHLVLPAKLMSILVYSRFDPGAR